MPRFTTQQRAAREAARERSGSGRLTDPPADETCESYAPGHLMHYLHQGQALRSPSQDARNVIVDGDRVVVILGSGEQLDFQHHEPDRLARVLGLFPASRVLYPRFHALRVGPYWFNCAAGAFEPCDVADRSSPARVGEA
jgi:hypothetical protein